MAGEAGATEGDRAEVLQGVLDRLTSYQESAEEGTVEKELTAALSEVGLELTDAQVAQAVTTIEKGEGEGAASSILG